MKTIRGKTALVTGAASGLGRAISRALAAGTGGRSATLANQGLDRQASGLRLHADTAQ